jgi:arabinose-5-phosphate isomerase
MKAKDTADMKVAPISLGNARTVVDTARKVLQTEAKAIWDLAEILPPDFVPAVQMILSRRGRVIVSGIGKSGHIARKIAATLASTGTPAYFIHPSEASHGDLGMITSDDLCLLISNSGESAELRDLIYYSRRYSIPLIGISKRDSSTLMRSADLRLTLPDAPEACPIGIAPTTSTTMALALGDALAACLMSARQFEKTDFSVFHPGGRLGAEMATVAQLMHTGAKVPLVEADTPMRETVLVITEKGFGIAGVVRNGALIGVITDGDLRRRIDDLFDHKAGDIASPTPITVAPGDLAAKALAILERHAVSALIVVDGVHGPVGVLHMHDLLRGGIA